MPFIFTPKIRSIVVKAEDLYLYSPRVWHVMLFVKHPELIISFSLAH